MRRVAVSLVTTAVLVVGCGGEPVTRTGPRVDVGHGSVEEVTAALEKEGMPCTRQQPEPLNGFEQVLSCTIGPSRITIVHFARADQSPQYEAQVREAGDHGVFADSWAARVPTKELAERIAAAIESRGYA